MKGRADEYGHGLLGHELEADECVYADQVKTYEFVRATSAYWEL
jgi:hypothetical protein